MGNLFDVVKTQNKEELFAQLKNETPPRQFFGEYIHEGELSILFGDSNAGKSILANDIAFFVSGGVTTFPDLVSPNVPTLYIDMEMSAQQFASRYKDGADMIPDKYSRATIDTMSVDEDKILQAVKLNIIASQNEENAPKFIIIDNITNGFGSIHSAKRMRMLIGEFKNLKDRHGLTILLIAHCPKRRKGKPITDDNLGGSKMIINFVDSAFAISTAVIDEDLRYIKQIKTRVGAKIREVDMLTISTNPYLHFEYEGVSTEDILLDDPQPDAEGVVDYHVTPEKERQMVEMLKQGRNYRAIAKDLHISWRAVMLYDIMVEFK